MNANEMIFGLGLPATTASKPLATMQADDSEPLTPQWFGPFTHRHSDFLHQFQVSLTRTIDIAVQNDGTWQADLIVEACNRYGVRDDAECGFIINTRGEFRQLCRLLGVELKEGE